jgi:hypothetical protein
MLVDLGECFAGSPSITKVAAGLEAPAEALLTLVRACDRVKMVKLGPLGGEPDRPLSPHRPTGPAPVPS